MPSSFDQWTSNVSGPFQDNAAGAIGADDMRSFAVAIKGLSPEFNVKDYGAVGDGVADDTAAVRAAVTATDAAGKFNIVFFPFGTYKLVGSFSLSGSSVQLRGIGAAYNQALNDWDGSVILGANQTGPVLDFTGYDAVSSFLGQIEHSDFAVRGDGVGNVLNKGIHIGPIGGTSFKNISISNTGGIGLYTESLLCSYTNIMIQTPVSAKANNVPYMKLYNAANGNTFINIGFRSMTASADTGAGGALVLMAGATNAPSANRFYSCWTEYLHPPTNGTLIHCEGQGNKFVDTQFWDNSKEVGSTGTSFIRLKNTGSGPDSPVGGNEIRGYIPGNGSGIVDVGVDVQQSYNLINGVKGYNGGNVLLASGVKYTYINLMGSEAQATNVAVINNSGETTNTIIDGTLSFLEYGGHIQTTNITDGGLTIKKASDATKGSITLGAGTLLLESSGSTYLRGSTNSSVLFIQHAYDKTSAFFGAQSIPALSLIPGSGQPALAIKTGTGGIRFDASGPEIRSGSGTPEAAVTAPVGSTYHRTDGGAGTSFYVKESGTGNTGWVAK